MPYELLVSQTNTIGITQQPQDQACEFGINRLCSWKFETIFVIHYAAKSRASAYFLGSERRRSVNHFVRPNCNKGPIIAFDSVSTDKKLDTSDRHEHFGSYGISGPYTTIILLSTLIESSLTEDPKSANFM